MSPGRRTELPYELWDVFTDTPFAGNPLAVVLGADGLTAAQMQGVAREFNLSETSFVVKEVTSKEGVSKDAMSKNVVSKDAGGARARFFTPARELPMAGHPSIGTVFALERRGEAAGELFTLELAAGPKTMELEREGGVLKRVWMNQGAPELGEVYQDRTRVAAALGLEEDELEPGLPVQVGSAGLPFLYVPVGSLAALARARLTQDALQALMPDDHKAVFVFTLAAESAPATLEVRARMLGLALGIVEDPATGSAHGPLGALLAAHGKVTFSGDEASGNEARFMSRQGVEMGRPSELHVRVRRAAAGFEGARLEDVGLETPNYEISSYEVLVGGAAVLVGEGRLFL